VEVQQDHMEAETAQEVADQMRKDWPERDGYTYARLVWYLDGVKKHAKAAAEAMEEDMIYFNTDLAQQRTPDL